MKLIKFTLNTDVVKSDILQSEGAQALVGEYAAGYMSSLGDGYACDVKVGHDRARAVIYAESDAAVQDCYDNNTLIKVVGI